MKKINKKKLATAIGTTVVSAFSATAANAESNPFAMTEMSDGYMQVAQSDTANYTVKAWGGKSTKKANEAACGEGKCGAMMDGDKMKKGQENSCGSMMKGNEGSCGSMDKKAKKSGDMGNMDMGGMDMKGGEMSCGAMMEKMKGKMGGMDMKGGEMSCGGMMEKMKNGEMSCGAMMEKMKGKMGNMDMQNGEKGSMGGMDMKKGGEMSCGSKIDPAKASGK